MVWFIQTWAGYIPTASALLLESPSSAMCGVKRWNSSHARSIKPQRPPTSIEVDPGINFVKRQIDAKFRQANWSGRVGSFPVPRLLTRFAPERTE